MIVEAGNYRQTVVRMFVFTFVFMFVTKIMKCYRKSLSSFRCLYAMLWKSHKKPCVFISIFLPHFCNYNTYGNRTRKKGLIKKRCASRATSGAISKFLLQDTTRNEGEGHWTNCSLVHMVKVETSGGTQCCSSVQVPFELPVQIPVQLLLHW